MKNTTIQSLLNAAATCKTLAQLQRLVNGLARKTKAVLVALCGQCNLKAAGTKGELVFRLEGVLAEMYLKAAK
jgi:hypothetical protein